MNQLNTDFRFELDSNISSPDKSSGTVYQIMHKNSVKSSEKNLGAFISF